MKNIFFIFLTTIIYSGCAKKATPLMLGYPAETELFKNQTIIIDKKVNLYGKTIKLSKQKLIFKKFGKVANGNIHCYDCTIESGRAKIIDNVVFSGDWSSNEANPEWYAGSDFSDPQKNFSVLVQLLKAGFKIELDQMMAIASDSEVSCENSVRNIFISGNNKENCGLILVTKHKNQFYSYFRSETGNNLILKNITLVTDDYLNKIYTEKEADYFFTGSYYQEQFYPEARPNLDSVIVQNCIVKGNISIAGYGSHSDNQSLQLFSEGNSIKKVIIKNNLFDQVNNPFTFSNMGYGEISMEGNTIKNFTSAFISVPESGLASSYYEIVRKKKGKVFITGNIFRNDKVVFVPDDRTLAPCVIKGGYGSLDFHDNILENLLSSNPNADVNTFYFTSASPGYVRMKNNTIKNVIGKGSAVHPACLVKQRWADRFYMNNNTVTLDKESLYKIGVIVSPRDDFSAADGRTFFMDFFQIGGQTNFKKVFHVVNNTFSMPYLNKSTEIYDIADLRFEKNKITIGYFGPSKINSTVSEDQTLFLGRLRLDRQDTVPAGNFIFSGNSFRIDRTEAGLLRFLNFPDGVQVNQKNLADKNYNYKEVVINDTFYLQETTLKLTIPDGENQQYTLHIHGKNNRFSLHDYANANHLRPNAKSLYSDIHIDDVSRADDAAPFVLTPDSRQVIHVANHNGNRINVLKYIYFQSLFNMAKEEDLLIQIVLSSKDKKGVKNRSEFYVNLHQKGRSFLFENKSGQYQEMDPSLPGQRDTVVSDFPLIQTSKADSPVLVIDAGNKHEKAANMYITNCENIVQYTLVCNILKTGFQKADRIKSQENIQKLRQENQSLE